MTGMDNVTREEWMTVLKKAIENCKKDKAANEKAKAKGYHNIEKEIVSFLSVLFPSPEQASNISLLLTRL